MWACASSETLRVSRVLKRKHNASRPSEHTLVREKHVKPFRWDHRLQRQNLLRLLYGSPTVVTLGQQYNVGEKPTVILYTSYINRHAGTPNKKRKHNNKNNVVHR